jgi:rfaE bifunctional protein nucleotidyltransferase chain/domain
MFKGTRDKVVSLRRAVTDAAKLRRLGKKLVVTNGSFDILHAGHVDYLERSRRLGDALFVALNSDTSLRRNKGAGRPVISEKNRARMLAALSCVDRVIIFSADTADDLLVKLSPDRYTKGGSFIAERLAESKRRLGVLGCRTVVLPLRKGLSTSSIIKKCGSLARRGK